MEFLNKLKTPEELEILIVNLKREGKKIVHCHGCYDLLHPGHIRQFNEAKKLGDILIVSLTADEFVNKGPHRPFFKENARAEIIGSLIPVDFVTIDKNYSSANLIGKLKPDIYIKSTDTDPSHPGLLKEKAAVEAQGGKLVFTPAFNEIATKYASTAFVEKIIKHLKESNNL